MDGAVGPVPGVSGLSSLLVLADGRFPSGGHAHSGGLEAVVATGLVKDLAGLEAFLTGRLATAGRVGAAFAAAACQRAAADGDSPHTFAQALDELDAGLDARTPSPALRQASRRQGRALLRAARAIWPSPVLQVLAAWARSETRTDPGDGWSGRADGPHHPVVLGVAAAAAGLTPDQAALTAAHGAVTGPASASVRLLGLDPYAVHAMLVRVLGPTCEQIAVRAAACARGPADALPADSAPLLDIAAENHSTWEVRLFAS